MKSVFPFLEPRMGGFPLDFLALSKVFATFAVPKKLYINMNPLLQRNPWDRVQVGSHPVGALWQGIRPLYKE